MKCVLLVSLLVITLSACSATTAKPRIDLLQQSPDTAAPVLGEGPSTAAPAYLQTFTDPAFGSRVTRISGDPGTPIAGLPGATWPSLSRHRYSTLPVWSADGALLFLEKADGLLLDGRTYKPIKFLEASGPNPLWHPDLADIMIETDNNKINFLNALTGKRTVKIRRRDYSQFHFNTRTAPSYDGKFVGVTARRVADRKIVCIVFNLDTGAKSEDIIFSE